MIPHEWRFVKAEQKKGQEGEGAVNAFLIKRLWIYPGGSVKKIKLYIGLFTPVSMGSGAEGRPGHERDMEQ